SGLLNWICRIEFVDFDAAVVGIDGCFNGIADVANLIRDQTLLGAFSNQRIRSRFSQSFALRVREAIQRRVTIDDPLDAPINDRWVALGVSRQPRSDLFHALAWVTVIENTRF